MLPLAEKMHGMAKVRVYYRGWIDYEIEDPQLIIDAVRPGPEFDRFLDIDQGESADSAAPRLMNMAASRGLDKFPPEVPGAMIVGNEAGWMMDPEDFSDDLSQSLDDLEARPVLHHYTSGLGVKGIVENRELWATHIYYLNDRSEYQATFDHALRSIATAFPAPGTPCSGPSLARRDQEPTHALLRWSAPSHIRHLLQRIS